MTDWLTPHKASERFTIEAESVNSDDPIASRWLYLAAAINEEAALGCLNLEEKPRTYEATVVSTAALYFKAGDYTNSRRIVNTHSKNIGIHYFQQKLGNVKRDLRHKN